MQNPVRTMMGKVNAPQNRKLRILCRPTHEGYQTTLGKIGHEFHMIQGPGVKGWDYHTRPLPANHYLYQNPNFYADQPFDLILSQQRFGDLQNALSLGQKLGLPVVHIDHTEPPPNISKADLKKMKALRADAHCFITEHNKQTWGGLEEDVVIPHGIDTDIFTGYTGENTYGISCVNHFMTRDVFCGWNLWREVTERVSGGVRLVGHNPGNSFVPSQSINNPVELSQTFAQARYFLNTSLLSPCPLSLLEAAAVGLPIVSTAYQEVPKIFTHGNDAFLSNNPTELAAYCNLLASNKELAAQMGGKARQTIINKFNLDQFTNNWNNVLRKVL